MRLTYPPFNGFAGAVALALAAVAMHVAGCTAVVDNLTEYCDRTSDCQNKGGAYEGSTCVDGLCRPPPAAPPPAGPWSCVGKRVYEPTTGISADVSIRLIDPVAGTPLSNLNVQACGQLDSTCATPISPMPVITNEVGQALLNVPTVGQNSTIPGFTGYFQITGEGRLPVLYHFSRPVTANRETAFPVPTPGQSAGFGQALMDTQDPERGAVIVVAKDCDGKPASGLTVRVLEGDARTRSYYTSGAAPSPSATETSATGIVFVFNVLPGNATVVSTLKETGQDTANISVVVRSAATISQVDLEPTPL